MSSPLIRIATRQSRLALWQAEHVASRLTAAHPELRVELVPMTTQGDRITDRPLAQVGGKGLFIKELELALTDGRADIAVHSMKDVPTELPDGMRLAAMLPRADARDAFVSTTIPTLDALPQRARVGTSSLRRQCQLLAARPDLQIMLLRGNVETRLRRLDDGHYDAIILASAGLIRLGLAQRITHPIDYERSLPAVGQGIVGIECRGNDPVTLQFAAALNDPTAAICCEAERAFARRLRGSCQSPIAGFAELTANQLRLRGVIGSEDGRQMYRDVISGDVAVAPALGLQLADRMLRAGADELLAAQRQASQ